MCMRVYTYLHTHTHMPTCVYTHIHMCVYVHTYDYAYVYMLLYTCVCHFPRNQIDCRNADHMSSVPGSRGLLTKDRPPNIA